MRNEIMTFKNEMFGEVRTMCDEKGEPWFVGKDVAEVLGYKDTSRAIYDHVDDEDKTSLVIQQSGSAYKAKTALINESGLYSLIMASKLPQAKEFKRWVTSEVLPQIRKTGGYIPVKDRLIAAKEATIALLSASLEEQQPKVLFAEAVSSSEDSIYIGDLARMLESKGIEVGQTRMFSWLRRHGYLFKNCRRPYQEWLEKGLFEVNETILCRGRRVFLNITTKVTAYGQRYFMNGFLAHEFDIEN